MEQTRNIQEVRPLVDWKNGRFNLAVLVIAAILLLAGLTGIIPPLYQSLGILVCCALMLFTGEIYLVYPVMLFYGSLLDMVAGVSTYRWFTFVFFAVTLLRNRGIRLSRSHFFVFMLYIVYCVAVVFSNSVQRCIFAVFDMACILLLVNCYLKDGVNLKRFFTVYVLCAFVAYLTGTQREGLTYYMATGNTYVEMVRNMATFEDPNYMGYFYTCAVFATVGLKLFTPKLRVLVVIALYAIILTTISMTAIAVNVILWLVYLLVTKSLNPKMILLILIVVLLVLGLYEYGLQNEDDPVLGPLALRISKKLGQIESGDYGEATSNRVDLQQYHMEYFLSQPAYKMLIGMNPASAIETDLNGYKMAAHSEYIDWLLNVGVLGTLIMVYQLISSLWQPLKRLRKHAEDRQALTVVMLKSVWICYAATLTLYGDYRFALLFLL